VSICSRYLAVALSLLFLTGIGTPDIGWSNGDSENEEEENNEDKDKNKPKTAEQQREAEARSEEELAGEVLNRRQPASGRPKIQRRPAKANLRATDDNNASEASTSDFVNKSGAVIIEWLDLPEEFKATSSSLSSNQESTALQLFQPRSKQLIADHQAMIGTGRDLDRQVRELANVVKPGLLKTFRSNAKKELHKALGELARKNMPDSLQLAGKPRHFAEVLRVQAESLVRARDVRGIFDHTRQGVVINESQPEHTRNAVTQGWLGRLNALVEVIDRASRYKASLKNSESSNKRSEIVDAFITRATEHKNQLQLQLREMIEYYPNVLAGEHTPNVSMANAQDGGEGKNAKTLAFRYDFDTGNADRSGGELNAIFKQEPETLNADGGLDGLGVDTTGAHPMRLSFRAKATAEVADLLGIGDLVVRTELASVNGYGGIFGIIMERAVGQVPVTDGWVSIDADSRQAQGLAKRIETRDKAKITRDTMLIARDQAQADLQVAVETIAARARLSRTQTELDKAEEVYNNAERSYQTEAQYTRVSQQGSQTIYESKQSVRRLTDQELQSATLRRDLVNAQLLDLLCGQVDRHMGNLMRVTDADGNLRVKLFDNDLAFGTGNYHLHDDRPWGNLVTLPKTVDKEVKKKILQLTPDRLAQRLAGLLSANEIQAISGRLDIVKAYLRRAQTLTASLDGQGAEVSWGTPKLADLFHNHDGKAERGKKTSYYGEITALPFIQP